MLRELGEIWGAKLNGSENWEDSENSGVLGWSGVLGVLNNKLLMKI
jgi:hypothetical protein